ncbi:MAG TPA: methyltransferase domain-containing protein [Burkholderiales bacterium]
MNSARRGLLVAGAAWLAGCSLLRRGEPTVITGGESPTLIPEVPYFPTPEPVVDAMLKLARVGPADLVYDLGCGDGRIVITAAAKYGARGFGVDIDPAPLIRARHDAERAGVDERVHFERGDLFLTDLRPATVVTLYLYESLNRRLMPKLRSELRPGARIVSHKFGMGTQWPPDSVLSVGDSTIYLWTVRGPAAA